MRRFLRQQSHIMDGARERSEKAASVCAIKWVFYVNYCVSCWLAPIGSAAAQKFIVHGRKRIRAEYSALMWAPRQTLHKIYLCAKPCWYYNLVNAHPKHKGLHLIKSRRASGTLSLTQSLAHIQSATPSDARTMVCISLLCAYTPSWACHNSYF